MAFTFADFAACEPRYAPHFALAPRAAWGVGMVTAEAWLARPAQDVATGVPYVPAVDDGDLLCRLVVDERLMRAAARCREAWHRLQELGGIHDSRAQRLLARERQAWEEAHQREAAPAAAPAPTEAGAPAVAATAAAPAGAEPEPARNPDEPYIETIRCSSCNECTQVNPRMFAYNDNKQAYIADLKAGTYKQLVASLLNLTVTSTRASVPPWMAST